MRRNHARARARRRIQAAKVIAEQVRAEARERAFVAPDDRTPSEHLRDSFWKAARHVEEEQEGAACELLGELVAIRLAAMIRLKWHGSSKWGCLHGFVMKWIRLSRGPEIAPNVYRRLDYSCRRAGSGSILDARLAGA